MPLSEHVSDHVMNRPNRRSRLVVMRKVAGGWQVLRLISLFVTCVVYKISSDESNTGRKHQLFDWRTSYSTRLH